MMSSHDSHCLATIHGHSFERIDKSWLQPLGISDDDSLAPIVASRRGQRSLMLALFEHYELQPPGAEELATDEGWVLRSNDFLQALAQRLGLIANADYVRTAIARDEVELMHRSLGKDAYQQTIRASTASQPVEVHGLTRGVFDAAMRDDSLKSYLIAVGRRLLALALPTGNVFALQRLRFAFPRIEDVMAPELLADGSQLKRTIAALSEEL